MHESLRSALQTGYMYSYTHEHSSYEAILYTGPNCAKQIVSYVSNHKLYGPENSLKVLLISHKKAQRNTACMNHDMAIHRMHGNKNNMAAQVQECRNRRTLEYTA